MPPGFFGHLESGDPKGEAREVASRLNAFNHLEIGDSRPSAPAKPAAPTGVLCSHCRQANEKERDTCWACFRPLRGEDKKFPAVQEPGEITLVIDGNTYRSGDPDTPADIRELMDRIKAKGYSQQLLVEWQNWRATRNIGANKEAPEEDEDVKVFKGNRVSVIRLDGKVYTSDDADLSPEMRRLFSFLNQKGVTPELMDQLRKLGGKVKFRPASTATPSDGDMTFWQDVAANRQGSGSLDGRALIVVIMVLYGVITFIFRNLQGILGKL